MKIKIEHRDSFTAIHFKEFTSLDLRTHRTLRTQIIEAYEPGKRLLLNLDKVRKIDSAGLSALLYLRKKIVESRGKLILTNLHRSTYEVLRVAGLVKIFDIYTSVETAIEFSKNPNQKRRSKPSLFLQVKRAANYTLVKIKFPNWLTAENCLSFERKIREYFEKSDIIILNFDNIRNIDSSGIATILDLKIFAKEAGKTIILLYKHRLSSRIFRMFSLEAVLPHFENLEEAIFSLGESQHINSKVKSPRADDPVPATRAHQLSLAHPDAATNLPLSPM